MFDWFRKVAAPVAPLAAKDPADGRKSNSSTHWERQDYTCASCKAELSSRMWSAKFCPACGHYHQWLSNMESRVVRKIFNGTRWVWQYKTIDGKSELRDEPYPHA